jgi:UDP-N-acetylmuramoyl-L-alanyl-D-glutamate--2,6-diaminopimelate ligase
VNVSNILAALGAGLSYGLDLETMAQSIAACRAVPGRFEPVDQGQSFLVAVDYAHTDDALRNAIQTARSLSKGKVNTLFGCGGDRDRTKRPLMAAVATRLADRVVLTSDNPRSEDPAAIIAETAAGAERPEVLIIEPDRAAAIAMAVAGAGPGDIVLIAGKGHETGQIVGDRVLPFDDRAAARSALAALGFAKVAP